MNEQLQKHQSALLIKFTTPEKAWQEIIEEYAVNTVFTNQDYEPYAKNRDEVTKKLLNKNGIEFKAFKDQVIFDYQEVLKDDKKPYTVFTPYKRKWLEKLKPDFHLKSYPTKKYLKNLYKHSSKKIISLSEIGFKETKLNFPDKTYRDIIEDYHKTRDFPGIDGTSKISVHLRFGTLSIRDLARDAFAAKEKTWLNELIWRDFYAMILAHFPKTQHQAFKPDYDKIKWRNNEQEFKAWCNGKTGYPIVDAGMRQLNTIGWMHNRVRMITASFLTKHLLIDWRWGEAYFAKKLIDYDMASNIGGWQWAASSGNDAVPYFRIFNPETQTEKFDADLTYVKKWVPEFEDEKQYTAPVVEHKFARERALKAFKEALNS